MAKSEFILAFNEIAETRKLPREVILEALKAALTSAYRRNTGMSSAQNLEVRIDEKTGMPTIWIEKEVVESVENPSTEVDVETAHRFDPEVKLGDTLLVEDTPEDFGRIAAQTAKQVILQRMREAEREAQFQEYQERVGDLVTGTVQSDTGDVVTVGLGRTEAILPRSQQMPGERYKMHEKVRAYVMEVRRTNRGPQIVLSRTHRNMLRRLLEYEVPEIYNGTVEIKGIAREPGARSKVAVAALQPGADPVGACVGMRGMRIQSIVKELNNEKIDVIEWNPDQAVFISKALSPARVSAVFLDDDPDQGRTAMVVVPDDQLSLAIGREGQNARLAAKLTGWRIDIKSVTEAASDSYAAINDPEAASLREEHAAKVEQVAYILDKKANNRPIMPEDYDLLVDFVKTVENHWLQLREATRSEWRTRREEARARVPEAAYRFSLEETDLPLRVFNILVDAGYNTVGDVMEQYYFDPEQFLRLPDFNRSSLQAVEKMVETITFPEPVVEAEGVQPETPLEGPVAVAQEAEAVVEAGTEVGEEPLEPVAGVPAQPVAEAGLDDELARARRAELVARMTGLSADRPGPEAIASAEPSVAEVEAAAEAEPVAALADESDRDVRRRSERFEDVDFADLEEEYAEDMTEEQRAELDRERAKQRRRELVYDEDLGRVVVKRRRKRGRDRDLLDWNDEEEL